MAGATPEDRPVQAASPPAVAGRPGVAPAARRSLPWPRRSALSYLWNEDFWWYLTSGRYLLDHHHFPAHDPFLYTADRGIGWVYHSWLWTVLVAVAHRVAGLGGVAVFHTLLGLALCAVVYSTARVDRLGLANALATALFLAVLGERLTGKAEIASWLLLAIFYRLLETDQDFTWRRGALLGALQILWGNLHGGYPLGIFIALCYSLGPWIEARLRKAPATIRRPPLWFPAVLFLLAVADPWLLRERLAPFAFVTGAQSVMAVGGSGDVLVLEWQSPLRAAATDAGPLWFYGLAIVAGIVSFALARRRPVARILFFLGMAVLGATAVRRCRDWCWAPPWSSSAIFAGDNSAIPRRHPSAASERRSRHPKPGRDGFTPRSAACWLSPCSARPWPCAPPAQVSRPDSRAAPYHSPAVHHLPRGRLLHPGARASRPHLQRFRDGRVSELPPPARAPAVHRQPGSRSRGRRALLGDAEPRPPVGRRRRSATASAPSCWETSPRR